ncbi:MAG: hypothetical protein GVY20_11945 [Bacteroidetes bacterium]|nr:hypothetical protein [Bacteroidota bacterium]
MYTSAPDTPPFQPKAHCHLDRIPALSDGMSGEISLRWGITQPTPYQDSFQ